MKLSHDVGSFTATDSLYKPAVSEQGWGDSVSDNFQIIQDLIDAHMGTDRPLDSNPHHDQDHDDTHHTGPSRVSVYGGGVPISQEKIIDFDASGTNHTDEMVGVSSGVSPARTLITVNPLFPLWAENYLVFLDPYDGVTWRGRPRNGGAEVTGTELGAVVSTCLAGGDKSVRIATADATFTTQIVVPARSLLVSDMSPLWVGGELALLTWGGAAATDAIVFTGNGSRVKGLAVDGQSSARWCVNGGIYTDLVFEDLFTRNGGTGGGGVTHSGARAQHINPHYRQTNSLGCSLYCSGGPDGQLSGDIRISGGGTGADDAAFRWAGDNFQCGKGHITGGFQVALLENGGVFTGTMFDTASGGNNHLIRNEGGDTVYDACKFYSTDNLINDDTYSVIRQNAAAIIQILGCNSEIAGSPLNLWKRFVEFNGANTKAIIIGNRMHSIRQAIPWNNTPLQQMGNTLNGVAYAGAYP